jgi:hypothetical protein
MHKTRHFPLLLLLVVLLAGCNALDRLDSRATSVPTPTTLAAAPVSPSPEPATPTLPPATEPAPEETETRGAEVEELQVSVLETFPVQVQATIRGNLPDGCTTIRGVKSERQGSTFVILLDAFRDPVALCTQALVPFEETIKLDVEQLAADTYHVIAGELQATFTLVADNIPPPAVDLSGAALQLDRDMGRAGDPVQLRGSGFPAGATVELGLGMLNGEYELVETAIVAANGIFDATLAIPDDASPGQIWVFVAAVDTATVISDHVTVIPGTAVTAVPPDAGVNVPANGLFTHTYIHLIALEDGGASGAPTGCGDSVIPVIAEIEPTVAPMGAAFRYLLAMEDEFFGESGLYNALHRSDLSLLGINIANRQATVRLSGELILGGACDAPRVEAQLAETALQYTTVDSVRILVDGVPLEQLLSGQ